MPPSTFSLKRIVFFFFFSFRVETAYPLAVKDNDVLDLVHQEESVTL